MSVFLFVFFEAGVFAGVAIGAGGAIIRVADALFRAEFFAAISDGDGFDGRGRDDVEFTLDILRGDLDGVEQEAGAARVDAARAEGIEDLSEGDLDGAAVFENGNPE